MLQNFKDQIFITEIPKPNDIKGGSEFIWKNIMTYTGKDRLTWSDRQNLQSDRSDYVPKAKDKLYFHPKCMVPRYKVRDWGKKYDISITVKREKATIEIASDNYINEYVEWAWTAKIKKEIFIKFLDINYDLNTSNLPEFYKIICNNENEFINLDSTFAYSSGNYVTGQYNDNDSFNAGVTMNLRQLGVTDLHSYCAYVNDRKWNTFKDLLTNPKLYSEESIVNLINEDAVIIDQGIYDNLRNIFSSNDRSNYIVAMETISNCNINPSLYYILLLFREFGWQISGMKESGHVNFKSLITCLNLKRNWDTLTDDAFVNCLLEKEVLTMDIVKDFATRIKKEYKEKTDSQHFKISTITVSDEIKQFFAQQASNSMPILNPENIEMK